jgi:PRTRC genetic system protein C
MARKNAATAIAAPTESVTSNDRTNNGSEPNNGLERVRRIFMHGSVRLADPNPAMSEIEVKRHYASNYPELSNASVALTTNEVKDGIRTQVWDFKRSVGTKG